MLGSSLFTALHLSLLQQPVLCRAVCAYSEISAHIGAVSLQMLLAFRGRFCFTQELAAGCTSPCCVYLPGDSVRLTYSLRGGPNEASERAFPAFLQVVAFWFSIVVCLCDAAENSKEPYLMEMNALY